MIFFQDSMWLLVGLITLTVFLAVAMLWRNHAAKTETVQRKKYDTVANSVSIEPKSNTKKSD